jgi:hypothetical protein
MVIDEIILPIIDIRLVDGQVEYVAEGFGPIPAVDTREVAIHDRNGVLVVRIHMDVTPIRWSRVSPGSSVIVVLPFHWRDHDHEAFQSGRRRPVAAS